MRSRRLRLTTSCNVSLFIYFSEWELPTILCVPCFAGAVTTTNIDCKENSVQQNQHNSILISVRSCRKSAGLGFRRLAWGGENRGKGDSGPPSRPHSTPAANAHAAAQQDSAAERPAQCRLLPHGCPMGKHKPTAAEWGSQVRKWGSQVTESCVVDTSRQSLKRALHVFDLVCCTPAGNL